MKFYLYLFIAASLVLLQACAAVSSFPTIARGGDTISVMIGGSDKVRKQSVDVILTDANDNNWNLKELGLIKSVFNLRLDGRAESLHYTDFIDTYFPWFYGHEPVQTILVTNLPEGVSIGNAVLTIHTNVDDDSSGISKPFHVNVEIIPGSGREDNFLRQDTFKGILPVDYTKLEPLPYAKIELSSGFDAPNLVGAISLVVGFDDTILNPNDISIYVPQTPIRDEVLSSGKLQQKMVYWRHETGQVFIDIISPGGINSHYIKIYLLHPRGLIDSPGFILQDAKLYDIHGSSLMLNPSLVYFP